MFQRLKTASSPASGRTVQITVDGQVVQCLDSDSVAAALFAAGALACRDTAVSGAARGPFCMMGVCYDCLVHIDGQANQQACMTRVRDGMRVERQRGARKVEVAA